MIGTIAATLLAVCGLPLMISTIISGKNSTPTVFFWTWYLGELGMLYYSITELGMDQSLIINYGFNSLFLTIICFCRFFPRK